MCSFKNGLLTTKFGAQINELKAEVAREQEVGAESESHQNAQMAGEVGGWGRDPKKCMGRDWGMGSSTIQ